MKTFKWFTVIKRNVFRKTADSAGEADIRDYIIVNCPIDALTEIAAG